MQTVRIRRSTGVMALAVMLGVVGAGLSVWYAQRVLRVLSLGDARYPIPEFQLESDAAECLVEQVIGIDVRMEHVESVDVFLSDVLLGGSETTDSFEVHVLLSIRAGEGPGVVDALGAYLTEAAFIESGPVESMTSNRAVIDHISAAGLTGSMEASRFRSASAPYYPETVFTGMAQGLDRDIVWVGLIAADRQELAAEIEACTGIALEQALEVVEASWDNWQTRAARLRYTRR